MIGFSHPFLLCSCSDTSIIWMLYLLDCYSHFLIFFLIIHLFLFFVFQFFCFVGDLNFIFKNFYRIFQFCSIFLEYLCFFLMKMILFLNKFKNNLKNVEIKNLISLIAIKYFNLFPCRIFSKISVFVYLSNFFYVGGFFRCLVIFECLLILKADWKH